MPSRGLSPEFATVPNPANTENHIYQIPYQSPVIIESVRVQNFRSIKDATLQCDDLTVLVGSNGSGKSSFLKAIELFYGDKPVVTDKDYHKNDTGNPIAVSVTFGDMSDLEAIEFPGHVTHGKLAIDRVFTWNESTGKADNAFHSVQRANPDFLPVRNAADANKARDMYRKLRTKPEYSDFPTLSAKSKIVEHLGAWERNHPDRCTGTIDHDNFELPKNRERFPRLVAVPAVRDASEDVSDTKNSSLNLLTMAITQSIERKPEYGKFLGYVGKARAKLMQSSEGELQSLGNNITENLRQFVGDAQVSLSWNDELPSIGLPKPDVQLHEDGHESTVDRAGHGSQRAFIMALLQTMAGAQGKRSDGQASAGSPALILSIEEPELYQHPIRQRHIRTVLDELARSADPRTQIIYTTHSPHFVAIDKLNSVRLLRKTSATKVHRTSTRQLRDRAKSLGMKKNESGIEASLKVIMTPWLNEGFFAKLAVLVEGPIDYAAIMSMSRIQGLKFEESGISVIPCGSVDSIPLPLLIFQELQIPTYAVWDLDGGKDKQNRSTGSATLQKIFNAKPNETQLEGNFSCFATNLEKTMESDIGTDFKSLVRRQGRSFGLKTSNIKNLLSKSHIMHAVLEQVGKEDRHCKSLETIVGKIAAKAGSGKVAA